MCTYVCVPSGCIHGKGRLTKKRLTQNSGTKLMTLIQRKVNVKHGDIRRTRLGVSLLVHYPCDGKQEDGQYS